jgi:putative transposase
LGKTEKLKEGEVKAVTIVRRNREYFAYIIIEKQAKELYKPSTFLGVDRGLKNVAVASLIDINGMTIHNPWFFAGGKVLHKRRLMRERKRIFGIVKRLDRIKDVRREESNFVRDINHKVSRQIVDIAFKNRSAIVLEDLEGIQNSKTNWGKEGNYMKSSWSYGQLRNMILYKAEELGVPVIFVNPRNTSKTCSKCGQIGERKSLWFSCHSCGYQYNADANASQNIAERGREQVLSSPCACEKGIVEMPIGR